MKKERRSEGRPSPAPPPGWRLDDGLHATRLTREIRFPSGQMLLLYAVYVLVLAARRRVPVTLACSGLWLSMTLLEELEPRAGVSRRLFNLATRLG